MSSPRPELLVAPCSYQAAKYAVEKWHYSGKMPVGKAVCFGVWEASLFVGAVIYTWGANHNLAGQFGLNMTECAELVRVALSNHAVFVSQVLSITARMIKAQSAGLRLLVSFADPYHSHVGAIYQAANWIYTGETSPKKEYIHNGVLLNRRAYTGIQFGKPNSKQALPVGAEPLKVPGKHRYLYPLDRAMRKQIAPLAQPYPKKDTRPVNGDTLATSEAGRFDSEPGALQDDL